MNTPTFPMNAWYAAAWDAEVGRDGRRRSDTPRHVALPRELHRYRRAWYRGDVQQTGSAAET